MSTVSKSTLGNGRSIPFYDGNLTAPTEIEGSGVVEVDPVTTARIIKRKYCQLMANYQPPAPGFQPFTDLQYTTAIFISEKATTNRNGLTYFERVFATIPPNRTERRLIPFTLPGQSAVRMGLGGAIGWDPYGVAGPRTRRAAAQVQYQYAFTPSGISTDPLSIFGTVANLQLSQITFQGKVVDFVGDVWAPAGTSYLSANRTSPLYVYQGSTTPPNISAFSGTPWLESIEIKRWMGQIWECALVLIPPGGVF